jgi:hypothetical protein
MGKINSKDASSLLSKTALEGRAILSISFIATQLTVTAGVAATISGISYYGLWFFLAPVSFMVGIYIFYRIYMVVGSGVNVFVTRPIYLRSPVMQAFAQCAPVINLFLIGWEFFVLWELFVSYYASLGGSVGQIVSSNSIVIILLLAVVADWYTSKGGWDRSVKTDIIQFAGMVIFVLLLVPIALEGGKSLLDIVSIEQQASPLEVFLFVLSLFIINLPFPFVTVSNWQIAQSAKGKLGTVLALGCLGLPIFFIFLGWLSLNMKGIDPRNLFVGQNLLAALLVSLAPLFTWSSVDTTIVALTNMATKVLQ